MKSIVKLLTTLFKYGSLISVVLNILKVALDEINEKFPELFDDGYEDEGEESPTPEVKEDVPEKKGLFNLPFLNFKKS